MANISRITTLDGVSYDLKDAQKTGIYSVIGTQTSTTASWTGYIAVDTLYDGLTIAYYLPYSCNGNLVTLNLTLSNGQTTGAVNVYVTDNVRMTTHYDAGSTLILTYWNAGSISINGTETTDNRWTQADFNSDTYTSAMCTSPSYSNWKTAICTNYVVLKNTFLHFIIAYSNSYQGALTMNVNGQGTKPIYINGEVSSDSNHNLLAGSYLVYYDGDNYYFRTDGKITASITGDAAHATTATKAGQDGDGNTISSTYVKKSNITTSVSGSTLTISFG